MISPTFFSDLLSNLIGALIGAVLAIPTGLWIDRKNKERAQKELDDLAFVSIRDELSKNLRAVNEFLSKECGPENIPFIYLSSDAWQTAQALGAFSQVNDYNLRKSLSQVYEKIEYIKTLSDLMWSMFFSTSAADATLLDRKLQILCTHLTEEAKKATIMIRRTLTPNLSRQ